MQETLINIGGYFGSNYAVSLASERFAPGIRDTSVYGLCSIFLSNYRHLNKLTGVNPLGFKYMGDINVETAHTAIASTAINTMIDITNGKKVIDSLLLNAMKNGIATAANIAIDEGRKKWR